MIDSIKVLKMVLKEDRSVYKQLSILHSMWMEPLAAEHIPYHYVKCLRFTEYFYNKTKRNKLFIPLYIINVLYLKYLSIQTGYQIPLNRVGKGLRLYHWGSIILGAEKIGDYCSFGNNAIIGRYNGKGPILGNHVYMAPNSTIIGDIKIGNYVIIASGAVVTKDVPNNSIVGGVPASLLKQNISIEDFNKNFV